MKGEAISFITRNEGKFEEIRHMLRGSGVTLLKRGLDMDEIQDSDVERVAERKAKDAFLVIGGPVLAEDTGLSIKAMNGYPGALVKHFYASIGPQGIVDFLKGKDRQATAVTALAYCDSRGVRTFTGSVDGTISRKVSGRSRFDWDVIFVPDGFEKTYAEMPMAQKNRVSQRRKALDAFLSWYCEEKGKRIP